MAPKTPKDDAAKTMERVTKLFDTLEELEGKATEVRGEIAKLLRGEPAIGDLLKLAMAHFAESWRIRYRAPYAWRSTTDVPQMKRLIKLLGIDELKARITNFIANDEDYFKRSRHGFGLFVATVNQHAGQGTDSGGELELASAPSDCRHVPPCKSDIQHTQRLMEDMRVSRA